MPPLVHRRSDKFVMENDQNAARGPVRRRRSGVLSVASVFGGPVYPAVNRRDVCVSGEGVHSGEAGTGTGTRDRRSAEVVVVELVV